MTYLRTFFAIGLLLLLAACGQKTDPTLLARVGPSEIHLQQFQQQMQRRSGPKPQPLDKAALLEEMIDTEALHVRALQLGLDKDPEVQRAYRNLLLHKLKERELAPKIEQAAISAEELRSAYEKDLQRYQRPRQLHLAVLFLRNDSLLNADKATELKNRLAEARTKALEAVSVNERGFGSLAITYSEDQASRYKGGDIGWVDEKHCPAWLTPAVLSQAWALQKPGVVSDVIISGSGVYLLKLLERREAEAIPLKDVEPALRQRLLTEKQQQLERAFVQQTRQSIPVETHPELLAAIPAIAAQNKTSDQPPSMP